MQHGLEFLSRLVFVLGVCSGGCGVVSVLAIDRFLIDKYRCSSRGRGEGGLGVAPLPSNKHCTVLLYEWAFSLWRRSSAAGVAANQKCGFFCVILCVRSLKSPA